MFHVLDIPAFTVAFVPLVVHGAVWDHDPQENACAKKDDNGISTPTQRSKCPKKCLRAPVVSLPAKETVQVMINKKNQKFFASTQ